MIRRPPRSTLSSSSAASDVYKRQSQHRYSKTRILSLTKKRWLVGDWLQRRYPVFQNRYAYNLGQLERLIRACKARGLRPVMLDLPRNMVVIKDRFYRPIQRYHQGCRALAGEYSIPLSLI